MERKLINTIVKSDLMKKTENETLATFQEEIPSIYFSHKDKATFDSYVKSAEYFYRDHFKFPKNMFNGVDLIDFGAGTGENTIYLANWGANCTLVEMNIKSQNISKKVFQKYALKPENHKFVLSSIFDYKPKDNTKYDIVHCRGVLSHTAAKELAFQHISTFLKPGGYLIFGDPNKAGGFQNMLQRFAVYKFAKTPDEMVDISEYFFKEDIDRSEKTIPRTRRAIIFDRWVIQSQDDPSVEEVRDWIKDAGLSFYSSYPNVIPNILGNSLLHINKFDPYLMHNLFSISEIVWMMQTSEDQVFIAEFNNIMEQTAINLKSLSGLLSNFNSNSILDSNKFNNISNDLVESISKVDFLLPIKKKIKMFLKETREFIDIVNTGNKEDVLKYIKQASILFKGACGVRHVDFIAYKKEN